MVATRVFEKLMRYGLWVLLAGLVIMLLLTLVRPTTETPEDEP
jgi:hypothetical protein